MTTSSHLQRKVQQLQKNVREWKESYDELMNELRKLTLERGAEKEDLVKDIKVRRRGRWWRSNEPFYLRETSL